MKSSQSATPIFSPLPAVDEVAVVPLELFVEVAALLLLLLFPVLLLSLLSVLLQPTMTKAQTTKNGSKNLFTIRFSPVNSTLEGNEFRKAV